MTHAGDAKLGLQSNTTTTTKSPATKPAVKEREAASTDGSLRLAQGPPVVYVPPHRGAPSTRVGGATRGPWGESLNLAVFAPNHTGLTTREQPSLYWFVSKPISHPIELTLVDPRVVKPVLEIRLPLPLPAGVHRFDLADHGIRLDQGVVYRWFVAVVADVDRRSRDAVAGGTIERVEPSSELRAKLAQVSPGALPALYASEGLWYDAISAISDLIEAAPEDSSLRDGRVSLLSQVGLPALRQ